VKKVWIKLQRDTKAFNYKYATLSQIQDKLSWEFEKQKLLILHKVLNNEVITEIHDIESDAIINSNIVMTEWTKPQDKWSEITYYRRYNLLSLLDLEVEDDDWKAAQESKPREEVKWYNDTNKNIDKWTDMIANWDITAKAIVKKIEDWWYRLSKANKDTILAL